MSKTYNNTNATKTSNKTTKASTKKTTVNKKNTKSEKESVSDILPTEFTQTKEEPNEINETNETNETKQTKQTNKTSTKLDKEYFNYVKEPLEKIVYMIDSQINYLNVEDVFRTQNIINNLKINIHESILLMIEFDKILNDRFKKLDKRKEMLVELSQLFIEQNKCNIENILKEREGIPIIIQDSDEESVDKPVDNQENLNNKSEKSNEEPVQTQTVKSSKSTKSAKSAKSAKSEQEPVQTKVQEPVQTKVQEPVQEQKKTVKSAKSTKSVKSDKDTDLNTQKIVSKPQPVLPEYCQQCNITELNSKLTNSDQQAIINRITTDADYAKVYLQNFEPNTDLKKKPDLKGTIKILGNYNKTKKVREAYEVKVFDSETKPTFWCSCADHKFNSAKKNIVCKHICFIVCKVLKILQTYYFDTKKLTSEHLAQLLGKFDTNSDIWADAKLVRKSNKVTLQDFKNFPEHITDTCTFCYDEMTDVDKPISVSCPLCKHCFHEECMGVWLESQSKCSFCSNNFWQYYKRIGAGETEIDLGCNQL